MFFLSKGTVTCSVHFLCIFYRHKKNSQVYETITYELSAAERKGFEPLELLHSTVFKTAAIDHSAISPFAKV